jgi:hypothetical protein
MSSWEYCELDGLAVEPARVYFYTPDGLITADIGKSSTGGRQDKPRSRARLVALLGRSGWELVSSYGGEMAFKRECSGTVSYSYLDELYLTEQQRRAIRGEDPTSQHDAQQALPGEEDRSPSIGQASAGSGCLGIFLLMGIISRPLCMAADALLKPRKG